MTGWNPGAPPQDPYGPGPLDPHAGRAAPAPLPPHPPTQYPVTQYQPYPNPGSWEPAQYLPRPGVPGALIAGSVLGYLLAVFLLVTGLLLLFFGSFIAGSFESVDSTLGDGGTSLIVAGLGNWIAAGLLIAGWVMATARRPAGLLVSLAGSGLVAALAVYWVVLYPVSGIVAWAIVHAVIAAVPAGLSIIPGNRAWMTSPPMPPRPPQPFPLDRYGRPFGT